VDELQQARTLIDAGQLAEAREVVVKVLYDDYDNLDAWLLLTHCAADRQEYARALRETLRLDPENVEARRLAVELARETAQTAQAAARTGEAGAIPVGGKRRRSRPLSLLANLLMFLIVVAIAGGVALAWLEWNDESGGAKITPTFDPITVCAREVEATLSRLPARCPLTEAGEFCLANPEVSFVSEIGATLRLPGDRIPLEGLVIFETRPYDFEDRAWGLALLRGKTSLADEEAGSVLFLATSGVRMRDFDPRLQQLTFSSDPVVSECPSMPPAGILVSAPPGLSPLFVINGATVELSGTAFFQVDTAAGLRAVALEGSLGIAFQGTRRVLEAGQWLTWPVGPTLLVRDLPGEVMTTAGSVRGNLAQLAPLGQAIGLPSEQWRLPGGEGMAGGASTSTPSVEQSPAATRTPTPRLATASPTLTETTPFHTSTPGLLPTPTGQRTAARTSTRFPTQPNTPAASPTFGSPTDLPPFTATPTPSATPRLRRTPSPSRTLSPEDS
jgi:hypothetical protein